MIVQFQTLEESKKQQLEEFLQLSKRDRLYHFFKVSNQSIQFLPNKIATEKSNTFEINFQNTAICNNGKKILNDL